MRGEREFISEIAALSDINHPNLVSLKGCCIHGAHRLLVYEYMENNSLSHSFLGNTNKNKFIYEMEFDGSCMVLWQGRSRTGQDSPGL